MPPPILLVADPLFVTQTFYSSTVSQLLTLLECNSFTICKLRVQYYVKVNQMCLTLLSCRSRSHVAAAGHRAPDARGSDPVGHIPRAPRARSQRRGHSEREQPAVERNTMDDRENCFGILKFSDARFSLEDVAGRQADWPNSRLDQRETSASYQSQSPSASSLPSKRAKSQTTLTTELCNIKNFVYGIYTLNYKLF